MKNTYTIILLLLISVSTFAQKSYKVMSNTVFDGMDSKNKTEIDDKFDKAKSQFLKILTKSPDEAMACFGLSVVYSYDDYFGKDYFEAWRYFKIAFENIDMFTDEDKQVLDVYFFKVDKKRRNKPIKKNMEWEMTNVEDKLIKFVREENNLEYVNRFLKEFPSSRYYKNVVHIRNYIEYRTAENTNTVEAFNIFIKKYPDAAQIKMAKDKRDAIAYKDALSKNSLSAMKQFVADYPKSAQVEDAKKVMGVLAYNEAAKTRDLQVIEKYMQDYPNSSKMPEARNLKKQLLFEWAKSVNTIEAYNKFVEQYPEGKLYIDIFNLKATALGQEILMNFPMDNYKFIKAFDNKSMKDFGGDLALLPNGNILVIANTKMSEDAMYDVWGLTLDANGKMLKSIIIGNKYDDNVNKLVVTSKNEAYISGVTNAIIDSVKGSAWLFKMGSDGKNLYNRKLDGNEITGLGVYADGKALVCSAKNIDDTTTESFLVRVNESGKQLWNRTYSQKGFINDVVIDKNSIGYVAGGTWYFAVDKMGYLKWSKIVEKDIKITTVNMASSENIVFAGVKSGNGYVTLCNSDGKTLWETILKVSNISKIEKIVSLPDNTILCATTTNDNKIEIVKIDNTGKILVTKKFSLPNGLSLNGIVSSGVNTAIISATCLGENSDILVFKLAF
jgi:outer membrane protein assembly factor BamD (BamD/ComL family)